MWGGGAVIKSKISREAGSGSARQIPELNKNYQLSIKNSNAPFPPLSKVRGLGGVSQDDYFKQLAERIKETNVKLVFIGLGAPKQEYFIAKLSSQLISLPAGRQVRSSQLEEKEITANRPQPTAHSAIFMSVGGAFDILSSRLKRASYVVRQLGFEWLWRLIQDPWRFGRQLGLIKFIFLILRQKFLK